MVSALALACAERDAGTKPDSPSSRTESNDDVLNHDCDVTELFNSERAGCTGSGCHGIRPRAGLDLRGDLDALEERLLAHESENCDEERLISVQSPEQSLLLRKVDPERFGENTCGSLMPPYAGGLEESDISCLESWLAEVVERAAAQPDFNAD